MLMIKIALILFNIIKIGCTSDTKWIESLKESVKNNQQISQVIFLTHEKSMNYNPIFEQIIKKLSNVIPVREIIIKNSDKPTELDFIAYNPRISLFVLTNSENDSEFTRSIDFLTELSEAKRRPKCLLLLTKELSNYRQFFKTLWTEQFLDVTIIKNVIILETILNAKKVNYDNYRIIHYNPFSNMITNEIASAKTIWFPDKLQNLHGYPLVASLIPIPPDVFAERNTSKQPFGLAINKIEILKEILNFTLVKSSISNWGLLTCTNAKGSGALEALFNNKVQILGIEKSIGLCNGKGIVFSKGLRTIDFALIVPLIKKDDDSVKVQWQKLNILTVMSLPLILWTFSRLMNFSPKKWKPNYLIRIVLGSVIPKEPQAIKERIIFSTFLIGCLMFSSDIYTSITQIQMKNKLSFKFETFKDVLSSNLEIFFDKNYFTMINNTDDVIFQEILKKSVISSFSRDECMNRLLKYKNNTCSFELATAEVTLKNKRDKCGRPLVKFLTEKLPSGPGATLLGANTPYANRFDQVIQRIIESGISKQWMNPYSTKKVALRQIGKSCSFAKSESALALHQMILVLVIGFGFSTLAFILELVIVTYSLC